MLNSEAGICCNHPSYSKPKIHLFVPPKMEEVGFVSETVRFLVS